MTLTQPQRCPENVKQLGASLLSYLLSISEAQAKSLIESEVMLDAGRIDALEVLSAAAKKVRSRRNNDHLFQEMDWARFQDLRDADGTNVFIKMRGKFAQPFVRSPSDPVLDCLLKMMETSFPFFLLPRSDGTWAGSRGFRLPHFFSHPVGKKFREAVRADADLCRLFPEPRGEDDAGGSIVGVGFGGTTQLLGFEQTILNAAFSWMTLGEECSLPAMASAVEDVLKVMRSLARGETVKIPALICLNGIGLPRTTRVNTSLGELRDHSGGVAEVVPRAARPPTGGPSGFHLGFVVSTEVDQQISISVPGNLEQLLPQQWSDPLRRPTDSVSLAVSLAIRRAAPVAAIHTTTLILNPFSHGTYGWSRRQQTPWEPVEVSVEEAADLGEWCDRIHTARDDAARVAVHRAIRALSGRDDPVDSFIDAIVAFESLFGERSQIALSIAVCVSKLLESDPTRRKATCQRVKKLYDQRSSILHGASPPSAEKITAHRDEALSFLVESFRALYRDRPNLLTMRASERDTEIILGP